jgi:hypothetical protein
MDHRQLVLGDAGGDTHALYALRDEKDHVANDGTRESHLQYQQYGGKPMPAQRGEDGKDLHGNLLTTP